MSEIDTYYEDRAKELGRQGYIELAAADDFFGNLFSEMKKAHPSALAVRNVGTGSVHQIIFLPSRRIDILKKLRSELATHSADMHNTADAIQSLTNPEPSREPLTDREASTLAMCNAWFGHRDERTGEAIKQVFRRTADANAEPVKEESTPIQREVWVCKRKKACGWQGWESDLKYTAVDRNSPLKVEVGHCPRCGGESFFVRKPKRQSQPT